MTGNSLRLGPAQPEAAIGDVPELWSHVVDELAAPAGGPERTLQGLAERICQVLDAGVVIFVTGADGVLNPLGFADTDPVRLTALRRLFSQDLPRVGEGLFGRVVESGRGTLVDELNQVPQEERFPAYQGFAEAWDINSFLAMPMVVGGDVIGVLGVGRHGDRRPLTAADSPLVERLADIAGRISRVALLMEHGRVAEAALDAISDAVAAIDQDCRITYWNAGAERLFGVGSVSALGRPLERVVHTLGGDLCQGGDWERTVDRPGPDGEHVSVEIRATALPDGDRLGGEGGGAVLVMRDVDPKLRAQREAERNGRLAQAALDASPMMSAVVSQEGSILAASAAWKSRIGESWSEGASLWEAVARIIDDEEAQADFRRRFQRVVTEDRPRSHGDYEVLVDGEPHTFSVHTTRVEGVGVSITIADITDRASRERSLSYEATHDVLTRLPNREVLLDRGRRALNRAARNQDRVGLLFCDLDAFKHLNDVHGHDVGDEVLEILAERLVESCRVTDTVVRLHGDEFAVLVEDSVSNDTAQAVADRVVASVARPMETSVGRLRLSASVGVVVAESVEETQSGAAEVETLLRQADAAMYAAKRKGRNRWVLYDNTLRVEVERADAFVGDLLRGAGTGEFILHMQPQFDDEMLLVGAEALLRWDHPERGLIRPFEVFQQGWDLPMSIGDWVVKQAAATLSGWPSPLPDGFRLGVNLSRGQWLDRNTPKYVVDSLDRESVAPTLLRIEVSQSVLSSDLDWSGEACRQLSDAGIAVAVNSFGRELARLADLSRLNVDALLLARRLVRDGAAGERGFAMLRGLVALGHSMGWRLVGTGVETAEQLEVVRSAGCDAAQGFVLGRPVDEASFSAQFLGHAGASGTSEHRE